MVCLLFFQCGGGESVGVYFGGREETDDEGDGVRSASVAGSISRSGIGGDSTGRRVTFKMSRRRKALIEDWDLVVLLCERLFFGVVWGTLT